MNNTGKIVIGVLVLIVVCFLCWYFSAIIGYILLAAVISFIGHPIVNLLRRIPVRNHRLPSSLCAGITLVILWGLLILFLYLMIPLLASQLSSLKSLNLSKLLLVLQQPLQDLGNLLMQFGIINDATELSDYIVHYISSIINFSQIGNMFGSVADSVMRVSIMIFSVTFISFFFLRDNGLFTRIVVAFFPSKYEEGICSSLNSIQKLLVRYFVGLILDVICIIILNTIGLLILGLGFSNAVSIGLMTGVLNLIPYIGPLIADILGLTIGFLLNVDLHIYPTAFPFLAYMLAVFLFTQLVDNVLFQPLIYGNSVYAHPLEIFMVILMAGSVSGILGMILAIPAYTVIRVILREFFNKYRLVKKITMSMTEEQSAQAVRHRHHGTEPLDANGTSFQDIPKPPADGNLPPSHG
ncbi:MAG: AI-2E family transporter [Marinifilaceae bacterium]